MRARRLRQNSGVVVKGTVYDDAETDWYGQLVEVVELDYGGNSVVLFKCNWFDPARGVKVDKHGTVTVNTRCRLNSNEPFVLASQASQVYYATGPDPSKNLHLLTVIKTKAQGKYNMPVVSSKSDEEVAEPEKEALDWLQEDEMTHVERSLRMDGDHVIDLCGDDDIYEEVPESEMQSRTSTSTERNEFIVQDDNEDEDDDSAEDEFEEDEEDEQEREEDSEWEDDA